MAISSIEYTEYAAMSLAGREGRHGDNKSAMFTAKNKRLTLSLNTLL